MLIRLVSLCATALFTCSLFGAPDDVTLPGGEIIATKVKAFASFGAQKTTETTAYIMVPSVLDDHGTFSVTLQGDAAITQVAFQKQELPEKLHFLFGNYSELHVVAPRPMDAFPGSVTNFAIDLNYHKSGPVEPLEQIYRIVDASGAPAPVTVKGAPGFSTFPAPVEMELPVSEGGLVTVPRLQGLKLPPANLAAHVQLPVSFTTQMVNLDIIHQPSNQRYTISFPERVTTDPVAIMLPVMSNPEDSGSTHILQAAATLVKPDGNPAPETVINLPESRPYWQPNVKHDPADASTITVTIIHPSSDGTVNIAVPPDALPGVTRSKGIPITVVESIQGLFARTSQTLQPGVETEVKLPRRLTLAAGLFTTSGESVDPKDKVDPTRYTSLQVKRVDENGRTKDSDYTNLSPKETTGSLVELKNLPVPGRYVVQHNDAVYGPVDVSDTSPTSVLQFTAAVASGQYKGNVRDEAGNPLAGALVLLSKDAIPEQSFDDLNGIVGELATATAESGLEKIKQVASGVVDFAVTTETGTYNFLRSAKLGTESVARVTALAPGRIPAYYYLTGNSSTLLPNQDVAIPVVFLPLTITATGTVYAPPQVPDNRQLGALMPMTTAGENYSVFHWNTRSWFGQSMQSVGWQYEMPTASYEFGKPFMYPVPAGTTFTLGARPENRDLHLSLQLWKHAPVSVGATVDLTSATLRALQPFYLQVRYKDGSPASGVNVSALYATQTPSKSRQSNMPQTDDNGRILLYGDEGMAPQISLLDYGNGRMLQQTFKIQPLDTSTSVPTLTIELDPKIWGGSGRKTP